MPCFSPFPPSAPWASCPWCLGVLAFLSPVFLSLDGLGLLQGPPHLGLLPSPAPSQCPSLCISPLRLFDCPPARTQGAGLDLRRLFVGSRRYTRSPPPPMPYPLLGVCLRPPSSPTWCLLAAFPPTWCPFAPLCSLALRPSVHYLVPLNTPLFFPSYMSDHVL